MASAIGPSAKSVHPKLQNRQQQQPLSPRAAMYRGEDAPQQMGGMNTSGRGIADGIRPREDMVIPQTTVPVERPSNMVRHTGMRPTEPLPLEMTNPYEAFGTQDSDALRQRAQDLVDGVTRTNIPAGMREKVAGIPEAGVDIAGRVTDALPAGSRSMAGPSKFSSYTGSQFAKRFGNGGRGQAQGGVDMLGRVDNNIPAGAQSLAGPMRGRAAPAPQPMPQPQADSIPDPVDYQAPVGTTPTFTMSEAPTMSTGADIAAPATTIGEGDAARTRNITERSADVMSNAESVLRDASTYSPLSVQAGQVTAGTMPGTDVSQYMNPYEQNVVDQTMRDMERAREIQRNKDDYAMGRAGAFGGSRHGIAQAESNRSFYDRAGALAGNLRQQGYTQAQNVMQQDLQRQLQADLANQGKDLTAQMANQNIDLAAAGQRMSGGLGLSNIGQQMFDTGRQVSADLMQQGNIEQLVNQQLIDAAKEQFKGYTGRPLDTIQYLSTALGQSPIPTSTETTYTPGLIDLLTVGASMIPGTGT